MSISGISRCISGDAGLHTIIFPACHDHLATHAAFPGWCLDPFRSYTPSFKLSSTPAITTIPTRTSIITLQRTDTILCNSNHTRNQPYVALGCSSKETVSPFVFHDSLIFVPFVWPWKGVGGRARHHNSRLAQACTELTTLFTLFLILFTNGGQGMAFQ